MSKPENSFIAGVHRHLDKMPGAPYYEKMHNPYRGGTFDVWYSGNKRGKIPSRDVWIEYKFFPTVPVTKIVLPDLSALQKEWGASRHAEGRNIWVIQGCPKGGVIYTNPRTWLRPMTANEFNIEVLDRAALAKYIYDFCCP